MDSPTPPAPAAEAGPRRYALHLGLFALTCFTTTWAGTVFAASMSDVDRTVPLATAEILARLGEGLSFSIPLMAILLTHEMGHFVLGRRHRVPVSLPYFIPLPPQIGIGTLGAVITMGREVRDRDALVDIGAAGQLAGLAVAIPVLVYGVARSPLSPVGPGILEGNSLLYLLIKLAVKGQVLPGGGLDIQLHPVAWAGWVGLLVTMLNLLPVGQLDGGHIATAFFGSRYDVASRRLHRAMLPLGLGASAYTVWELSRKAPLSLAAALGWSSGLHWVVWWGLLALMRRASGGVYHPPVSPRPLSPSRRRVCLAVAVIFLLIFIPIPLRPTL